MKGITDEDINQIDRILEFYKQKKIPVQYELTLAYASSNLMRYLTEMGFGQSDFHTTLYRETSKMSGHLKSAISIGRLEKNEFDVFANIYAEGFNMPSFLKDGIAQNNKVLYDNKHWVFYLASVEDQTVGIGVVFIKDKLANLAAATTLPAMRNHGVHQALINKRIKQAFLMDCDLIVGQAKFGSISQNNMERCGMRIAYTKAIWVPKSSQY